MRHLSSVEEKIIDLSCAGFTPAEIAEKMNLALESVTKIAYRYAYKSKLERKEWLKSRGWSWEFRAAYE